MTITNYAELVTSIAEELDRNDLEAKIPEWIFLAESALGRFIKLIDGEQLETGALIAEQAFLDLPVGLKRPIHFELQDAPLRVLNVVSWEQRSSVLLNDLTGRARTVSYLGRKAYFAPVPATAENFELFYYGQPPRLSAENDTNDLLEMGPDVLKYAAMIYSSPYLMDDERIITWKAIHDEARATLKLEYWNAHADGGILVIRPDFAPGDSHDQGAVQT